MFELNNFDFVDTLKDRDRAMIFMLLDKIALTNDARFIPVLEYWKGIDYKKVRARIEGVIKQIEGN